MTDKPNEMLPCPFCGRKAQLRTAGEFFEEYFWVECSAMSCIIGCHSAMYKTKKTAIKRWNKRPASKLREALIAVDVTLRDYEAQDGGHEAFCARQIISEALKGNE